MAAIAAVALTAAAWLIWFFLRPAAPPPAAAPAATTQTIALPPADAAQAAAVPDDAIRTGLAALVLVESQGARATGFFSAADTITTTADVARQKTASVTLPDGRVADATVIAVADQYRLARLRVSITSPAWLPVAPTRDVRSAEAIARLTWPQTAGHGAIKGLHRDNGVAVFDTSSPPHTEDEGAPLVDRTGRVVGIVSAHRTVSLDGAQPYFR